MQASASRCDELRRRRSLSIKLQARDLVCRAFHEKAEEHTTKTTTKTVRPRRSKRSILPSVNMPTPESELFKSQKPQVAPTFNGVDYDDTKAFKAAEDAIIREQWVGAMKTRIVGEELGKCYMREGVNHLENCGELRGAPCPIFLFLLFPFSFAVQLGKCVFPFIFFFLGFVGPRITLLTDRAVSREILANACHEQGQRHQVYPTKLPGAEGSGARLGGQSTHF